MGLLKIKYLHLFEMLNKYKKNLVCIIGNHEKGSFFDLLRRMTDSSEIDTKF